MTERVKPNLPTTALGIEARRNGMHQYAVDHDRFAALAIDFQRDGREVESLGARAYAAKLKRAWEAEFLNPDLEGLLPEVDG